MSVFYYDTCVFGNSVNPAGPEHPHCKRITDAPSVTWQVAICRELIEAESTYRLLVDTFEVQCALHGVIVHVVSGVQISASARQIRQHKRALTQMGISDRDWRHICAALVPPSERLVSTDPDFIDPANKRVKNGSGRRVAQYLERNLNMPVSLPSMVP